ncbi:MAG: class I SAM-dependent methyltransferase [Elusimicrobiota bacterium]
MKCPICAAEADIKFIERFNEPIERISYDIRLCSSCGIEFADPMRNPGPEWYKKSEFYRESDNPFTDKLNSRVAPFFRYNFPKNLKLLDVGCGFGNFLFHADKHGFICAGIDFSDKQLDIARSRFNLSDLHAATLEYFHEKHIDRKFDVITLFGFLEHQANPAGIIDICKDMLNKEGYIALNVPNRKRPIFFGRREDWDFPPHHLTRWDDRSLTDFMLREGFEVIMLKKTPMTATPIYNQLLGIPLNKAIKNTVFLLRRIILGHTPDYSARYSMDELAARTGNSDSKEKSIPAGKPLRKFIVQVIRTAAWLVALPVSAPLSVYFSMFRKGKGGEIFLLARKN